MAALYADTMSDTKGSKSLTGKDGCEKLAFYH